MNKVHFSSQSNEWSTPQALFDKLNSEFGFTLDPCATSENAKCSKYYTKQDDGLSKNWNGERVFVNPPYGHEIGKWVKKAYEEYLKGAIVIMLIPARTDTSYFHDYILGKATLRFIRGRIKFSDGLTRSPFPSMIVIFKEQYHA